MLIRCCWWPNLLISSQTSFNSTLMTFSCASLTWTSSCLDLTEVVVSQSVNVKRVETEALQLVRNQWHQQSGCCPSSSLFSAAQSAVTHQKPLLGSPWASPPDVSTAMERPIPIFVGSVDAGWLADMLARRRQGECALMEGEGPERSCCSSALCSSEEGMTKAPGFIDPCSWSCPLFPPTPTTLLHSHNYIYTRPSHPPAEDSDSLHVTLGWQESSYFKCCINCWFFQWNKLLLFHCTLTQRPHIY